MTLQAAGYEADDVLAAIRRWGGMSMALSREELEYLMQLVGKRQEHEITCEECLMKVAGREEPRPAIGSANRGWSRTPVGR